MWVRVLKLDRKTYVTFNNCFLSCTAVSPGARSTSTRPDRLSWSLWVISLTDSDFSHVLTLREREIVALGCLDQPQHLNRWPHSELSWSVTDGFRNTWFACRRVRLLSMNMFYCSLKTLLCFHSSLIYFVLSPLPFWGQAKGIRLVFKVRIGFRLVLGSGG